MFDPEADDPTNETTGNTPMVAGLEILDVIASGGHGTVYRARQQEHDRLVALKLLDARFVDDTTRRRFDRERVALGRISDHPSIVSLLDSGYTETGAPYLLLEFAPGGSLAERIAQGPLALDEATALVIGLAAATERTHSAGVVHRDIKPANILRSAYDHWMLSDFGIASLLDRSATGVVHASYAHTAPETFDGNSPTPVADVYSLASVLATCLTGSEPFEMAEGEAAVSVMRRVMSDPYPDLRRAGVANDLAGLLEMALSKEPAQRPVSARSFAAALNDIRIAHGLMPVAIRTGEEASPDSTVVVDHDDAVAAAASNWSSSDPDATHEFRAPKRRMRAFAAAACLVFALFGLSFAIPSVTGVGDGQTALAAVFDGVFDDDNGGNGNNNNGNGNGNGNGPGNGGPNNNDNADDADNDDDDGAPVAAPIADGDGDGNGPGNNNNGNGPGGGGRGGNGGGNGNGPGNGGGNGGGNGPGNGGGGGGGNGPGGN